VSQARASETTGLPKRLNDEELLAGISAGEQPALRQLIDRHGRGLHLFAARYLGGSHEAEDVVQDVFFSVWNNAKRFDPAKGRATTWIYRIAVNRCIDVKRWRRFRVFLGFEDTEGVIASEDPPADTLIGARQELAIVRAGLEKLPERQRMALLLRAVAGLDVPAIAEAMGTSAGSIEQLLVRARRTLRVQLTKVRESEPGDERLSK
jgi:RNA polymerase sigma-70 factor, ECF subfamily